MSGHTPWREIKRKSADPIKRIPWYAWPVIIFAPGGWILAAYYMLGHDKKGTK